MATVQTTFKNVFTYSAGMEQWCKRAYKGSLMYTFTNDFAIGDWSGEDGVIDTYNRVKESWLNDYKAWTEVVIALNLLAWAHDQLKRQGIDDRDRFIELYSDLCEKARDEFKKKYENDMEARRHHFFRINLCKYW